MKTLFVSDLDGTLITKEERVSAFSCERINRLIERGMLFTVATARSVRSAKRAVSGLNLSVPLILYNGGLIRNVLTNETLHAVLFGDDVKYYVLSVLNEHGIDPLVFGATELRERVLWRGAESEGMARYLGRRRGDDRFHTVTSDGELLDGSVFYFKCIGPRRQLEQAWNILKYDNRIICIYHQETYQQDFLMEIFPREATKAKAVSFLKDRLGCDKLVCFGDTSNDSDMFDVCDEKYAVLNADDWLKAKATGVIGYCEEDGVAKWLESNSGF